MRIIKLVKNKHMLQPHNCIEVIDSQRYTFFFVSDFLAELCISFEDKDLLDFLSNSVTIIL